MAKNDSLINKPNLEESLNDLIKYYNETKDQVKFSGFRVIKFYIKKIEKKNNNN